MASEVDICNTALAHLGSDAAISSIDPPDGSTEAGYCRRFYPIARKEMIEAFAWRFAQKRLLLAEVDNPSRAWSYAYALPSDCVRPLRVLTAEQDRWFALEYERTGSPVSTLFDDSKSAAYEVEDGILYTHEPQAVLLYLRDVVDTTRFTPGFVAGLSYLLASYLAGPLVRGGEGVQTGQGYRQQAMQIGGNAAAFSANASSDDGTFVASHMAVR